MIPNSEFVRNHKETDLPLSRGKSKIVGSRHQPMVLLLDLELSRTGRSSGRRRAYPPEVILQAHNVVLAKISTALHLDKHQPL